MQVDRLRLVGFKSFVDATELVLEPGLTGIVGPNGCGKSNLVEALRWAMGESSARRLRGGEMDDVIFGGTAGRPARNIAEVALTIDNSARDAPFAFNDREQIEIVRRIERGAGSTYRINGSEARARDVQLLFADAATGPHSGALVGQGRIGALIAAKPAERRQLLDEAAGTAGLHARRHEAELKLKAAEDNLLRLDDVVATLAAQLDTLKRQARQAQRYRRLGEQIRQAEALLLWARWRTAEAAAAASAGALRAAEREVAAVTATEATAARALATAETALPPLRLADAAATAAVQRLAHADEALAQELKRIVAARLETEGRQQQIDADLRREDEHAADAAAALKRLADERRMLAQGDAAAGPARDAATARRGAAAAALAAAETALQRATETAAADEARRAALLRRRGEIGERRARLETRRAGGERERIGLQAALVAPAATASAAAATADADATARHRRDAVEALAQAVAGCRQHEAQAAGAARAAEHARARLTAEAEGLDLLLAETGGGATETLPVLAALRVADGFEAAIGALFGDELGAPLLGDDDRAGPQGWRALAPHADAPALPAGSHSLDDAVTAPAALARRLTQAGWVETEAAGWQLQPSLAAGQSLVDRDGRLWRWDGFVRLAATAAGAAQHLRQRNRRATLAAALAAAEPELRAALQAAEAAGTARREAEQADRDAAQALRAAETALAQARAAEIELARRGLGAETRLAALVDTVDKLSLDLAEAAAQDEEAARALALLPEPERGRAALAASREAAAAARRDDGEARAAIDGLTREAAQRGQRLTAIDLEERSWRKRGDGSAAQRAALGERRGALAAEIATLAARPAAIAAEAAALTTERQAAAARQRQAGDALAIAESGLREATTAGREADRTLAAAREQRARADGLQIGAAASLARLRDEIDERVAATPEALPALAGLAPGMAAQPIEPEAAVASAARLDRLLRERDGVGPVNLVAESEAGEVEARVATLTQERAELTEAIARLRRGIAALDHEGRKRLTAAFARLNEHFTALFERLFGGGQARLTLADDDDPLTAGLEIMASPPGKRLQSLSLLSGGEQALTAIALLFAVFLTNPAPVCVLDEVDAPLDDANIDRFCRVIAETADATGTRFLLITHHRITMARMDRLFGVTMRERGVSQLVSVDLARAAELRRTG